MRQYRLGKNESPQVENEDNIRVVMRRACMMLMQLNKARAGAFLSVVLSKLIGILSLATNTTAQ